MCEGDLFGRELIAELSLEIWDPQECFKLHQEDSNERGAALIINGVIAHVLNVLLIAVCREGWKPGFHFERARSGLFDNGDDLSKVRKGLSFLLCPTLEVSLSCMYPKDWEGCAISCQDCEELWPLRPFHGDQAAGLYFCVISFFQILPTACGPLSSARRGAGQIVGHLFH